MALHVTNGDATVPEVLATGLMDAVLPWRDVLHGGPVPAVGDEELRTIRAGEYVLWFEADLYDQLQLVQILARLRSLGVAPAAILLVCIGEHPGIAHFGGLGELSAEQLARLPERAGG